MKITTSTQFATAVCDVLGIDYREHPVLGVTANAEQGAVVELCVRFAVPYGLMAKIDAAMAKVGAGGTAHQQDEAAGD